MLVCVAWQVVNDLSSVAGDGALNDWQYMCVLDGHGGARCADFAQEHLHRHLASELTYELADIAQEAPAAPPAPPAPPTAPVAPAAPVPDVAPAMRVPIGENAIAEDGESAIAVPPDACDFTAPSGSNTGTIADALKAEVPHSAPRPQAGSTPSSEQATAEEGDTAQCGATEPDPAWATAAAAFQSSCESTSSSIGSEQSSSSQVGHGVADERRVAGAVHRAFTSAFKRVDLDFLDIARAKTYGDGTTVLCALLRGRTLDIANVGDTRAVLGRKPDAPPRFVGSASARRTLRERDLDAVRLSVDHKPNLPDETERVQAAGGFVKKISGCWRVAGPPGASTLLAVSRALGNVDLKDAGITAPLVSCTPQMKTRELSPRDRLLILATDGLWDVMTDAQAMKLACESMRRAREGASSPAVAPVNMAPDLSPDEMRHRAASAAAQALVHRAMELGSLDNVTVLVASIDWASEGEEGHAPSTAASSHASTPAFEPA
jgi:serine/threonine protein phosphatase PrpC